MGEEDSVQFPYLVIEKMDMFLNKFGVMNTNLYNNISLPNYLGL